MWRLESEDGELIEISSKALVQSTLLSTMSADLKIDETTTIPVKSVGGDVLRDVVAFCEHHRNDDDYEATSSKEKEKTSCEVDAWDTQFLEQMSSEQLREVLIAADFLEIERLVEAGVTRIAASIRGLTAEQMRAVTI